MWRTLVTTLAACWSAGCMPMASMSSLPPESSRGSLSGPWTRPAGVVGEVPLDQALQTLLRAELVDGWPTGAPPTVLTLRQGARLADLRDAIEESCMWVLVDRRFERWSGIGANDTALLFGRPRTKLKFSIRFMAANANASFDEVGVGGTIFYYQTWIPDGGEGNWNRTSQRSIILTTPVNVGNTTVAQTQREVSSAGVTYTGTMAYLPGGFARVEGDLVVSSFIGRDLNQSQITAPLRLDIRRGQWTAAHTFIGGDAAVAFGMHSEGLTANVSGDAVRIEVRVD